MSKSKPAPAKPDTPATSEADVATSAKKKGKGKLLLIAVPLLLVAILAGGWFSGVLPGLLGMGRPAEGGAAAAHGKPDGNGKAEGHGAAEGHGGAGGHAAGPADVAANEPGAPIFTEVPLIVANLNTSAKRPVFVKLTAKLEIARAEDREAITAAMPRLLDIFQTYLRETRPEELQGAAGTWRLRQELIARANIAASPARVLDVLFTEMLIQ